MFEAESQQSLTMHPRVFYTSSDRYFLLVSGLAVGEYSVSVVFRDEVVSTVLATIERVIEGVEVKADSYCMGARSLNG